MIGLKRMHEKIERGIQAALSVKRIEMERRIVKSIIMTTLGFLITWTPYTIAFFLAAFRGKGYGTPPAIAFLCACFAKTSVVWIPIIYASTSTQFQWSFVKLGALEGLDPTNRVGPGHTLTNMNQGATNARETVKRGNQVAIH
ncbi:unnamed protein product [Rotaria sp. Silwood1]|nr:unnamed protein product [Rotaria sp. Silwood1]CAF3477925.1 unnamed protein product [Rotaria sp. Silwood1]CAF3503476.1 unnamed protein product [Rotaria sp. Silwood1]CAF3518343.1 unnamed protein product [Rotaria sp. Silwood1]CAF4633889.1 unnamed protein product [Rotaria sp. Silwood1]